MVKDPPRPIELPIDDDGLREAVRHDDHHLLHFYFARAIERLFPAADPPDDDADARGFEVTTATRSPVLWTSQSCPRRAAAAAEALAPT